MRNFSISVVIAFVTALGACAAAPPADAPTGSPTSGATAGDSAAAPDPAPPASAEPASSAAGDVAGPPADKRVGGGCAYEDTPGTATVTAIVNDTTAGPDCKHAKRVTLSFKPTDPAAKVIPMDQSFPLEVGGMGFAPEGCLKANSITVGSQLPVVRHVITSGTCSPRVYEVTALSSPEATERCVAHCR